MKRSGSTLDPRPSEHGGLQAWGSTVCLCSGGLDCVHRLDGAVASRQLDCERMYELVVVVLLPLFLSYSTALQ